MKLSEYLKLHTQVVHQQFEKYLVTRLKNISTPAHYLKLLESFYGFVLPIEKQIDLYLNEQVLPYHAERRKASRLKNDIIALNGSIAHLEISADIPQLDNIFAASGALYVLEGSTLGGAIISKMLSQRLALPPGAKGLQYFGGYQKNNDQMWDEFKGFLDTLDTSEEAKTATLNGATQTFIKFKRWIEQHEQ